MLAAPSFDTYGVLQRFAQHPHIQEQLALFCLLRRTQQCLMWDICAYKPDSTEKAEQLLSLRMGAKVRQAGETHRSTTLANMTPEDAKTLYEQRLAEYKELTGAV